MKENINNGFKNITLFLAHELSRDKVIYWTTFISTVLAVSLSFISGGDIPYNANQYLNVLVEAGFITLVIWYCYYYLRLLFKLHPTPLRALFLQFKLLFTPYYRPIYLALIFACIGVSLSNFTFVKANIPFLNPYQYDLIFSQLDQALHFGYQPWQLTHAWFSSIYASLTINIAYNAWFFVMWVTLIFFIFYRKNDHLRKQFLLCFFLSWFLIGGGMATILSSMGPCYFEQATNSNLYIPLMIRLSEQSAMLVENDHLPLWAINTQKDLWVSHINQSGGIGAGISAMPSMHVSIAVLIAISLFKLNKTLGVVAWGYAILIQIGSVHLGWHYAVDGYISAIMTSLLWLIIEKKIHQL
ncbi:phosphatase PAP2 family protein [Vibrio sp. 10N.286.49.B3]|uniref:phosphatase PAP2 family protein n=1 Tax=Vibrio sp. 10N.286.49.B3 TaxID=1880855 RepID=UPI0012FFF838|nr:phosphatase PAP2 family protein [Vibrio sp. 10N.286.49.B3]